MDEDMNMDAASGYGLQPAFQHQPPPPANTGDPSRKQL